MCISVYVDPYECVLLQAERVVLLGLRVPGNKSFSLQCSILACLLRADTRVITERLAERDGEREKEEMKREDGEVERDTALASSATPPPCRPRRSTR